MSAITRLAILCVFFALPAVTHAMSFSPTATDIELAPGGSTAVPITIFHDGDTSKTYSVRLVSASSNTGPDDLSFSHLDPRLASSFGLSETLFTIAPGESKELTLSVRTAEDAPSGVYVVAVFVVEETMEHGMIGTSTGVAPLVFLTIGDVPASLAIADFSAQKKWSDGLPVSYLVTLENTGLRVAQPDVQIRLKNMFGETLDVLQANTSRNRVLSGTARAFTATWGMEDEQGSFLSAVMDEWSPLLLGPVKAELVVKTWEGSETLTDSVNTFFFPWRSSLILVTALGLFFFIVRRA